MPFQIPPSFDRGTLSPSERAALVESLAVVLWTMRANGMLGDSVRLTDQPPKVFGLGAQGPLVGIWQTVVGAKKDSIFGPKTVAATRQWSKAAGFGDRSAVDPAMWCLAVGITLRFEGPVVVFPDGSRLDVGAATADAQKVLGGTP